MRRIVLDDWHDADEESITRAAVEVVDSVQLTVCLANRPPPPRLRPLVSASTLTLAGFPTRARELVPVPDVGEAVRALSDAVRRRPQAAAVLGRLLRQTEQLTVPAGLAAEAAAYSMLLGGDEFADWLTRRPPVRAAADRPPRPDATPDRSPAPGAVPDLPPVQAEAPDHPPVPAAPSDRPPVPVATPDQPPTPIAAPDLPPTPDTGPGRPPVRAVAPGRTPVRVERDGDLLSVVLDRPERRNALGASMRAALCEALEVAVWDGTVQRVDLSGAGPVFCSGGDLAEFGTATDLVAAYLTRLAQAPWRLVDRVRDKVTVRVGGAAVGAGVEVAAFAGRVVAASDAWFALPEVAMGLVPGAGGTVSVPRRIGRWRAAWLMLTGTRLDAATALEWGLVDEVS
ncbi:enoyl-CoA hydratase-related protein [Actinophytocola oryzae]|uniref:Enoyl-CoA hydratase/isomerase-like protein n=1 Tax=Actinophytocola oryzae TaxID=502181 RepID=A0A4R7VK83_9PSEU|nr:enoyl-CoA hydratase-related protein [Actinophytocola oryzae]TDV49880.1 enoyl-CoA hydratase/isomerase-like protein [Actinophytocola oryzae]